MKNCFSNLRTFPLFVAVALSMAVACGENRGEEPNKPLEPEEKTPKVTLSGVASSTTIDLTFTVSDATRMAWLCVGASSETEYTAEEIFTEGEVVDVESDTVKITKTVSDLTPETTYVVWAAAATESEHSEPAVYEIETLPEELPEPMLSAVSHSKTGFTYHIEVPEGTTYQHGYVEGWYYDYMLEEAKKDSEFDMNVFLWNMLVDFGIEGSGPQDVAWEADENVKRQQKAHLVGGHHYYAMVSLFQPDNDWQGTPEAVRFDLDPAGTSSETIKLIEEVAHESIKVRMECDPDKVNFFYYDLYTMAGYEQKMEEEGQEGMMNYLFEKGYHADNTYTDTWEAEGGNSYMLAILGVDNNGDIFFMEKQLDTPEYIPTVTMSMKPYNRELSGYHAYETFELYVEPMHFGEIDSESVLWRLISKAEVDMYLEYYPGVTLETLDFNTFYALFSPWPLIEEHAAMLDEQGYINAILESESYALYPDTEYCFFIAIPTGDETNPYMLAYTTAKTEAEYGGGEPEAEYSAYLGEWTLTGVSTEDYDTPKTYTLRFEELTPNRSFKVYGWSSSDISQKYPFEVRYHPDTKKISIEGDQTLGVESTDDGEMDVIFGGMFYYNGELTMLSGYSGTMYTGRIEDNRLMLFPELFKFNGRQYDFSTLAYSVRIDGEYFALDGDEYSVVNFIVERSGASAVTEPVRNGVLYPVRADKVRGSEFWKSESSAVICRPVTIREDGPVTLRQVSRMQ